MCYGLVVPKDLTDELCCTETVLDVGEEEIADEREEMLLV